MGSWADFFAAELGAAAALTGLVIVGISINVTRILQDKGLPGRAIETLVLPTGILVASTYALVPHQPDGLLGIEQHRAAPGQNPTESSKRGYLPEAFVIEQVEAAGFKLAGKSELNANPKDTKDYPEGVWSLPPTLREGEKNRDKYLAIGESDRMTLKFVKVTRPSQK